MIKKYSLVFIALLCSFFYGFGQSDIIISQYIETNSGTAPKGIEVFNVSGADIDFSVTNLTVQQGTNGGACSSVFTLTSGILLANEVWVIGTNAAPNLIAYAIANGTSLSGTNNFNFTFNGNDSLQLYLGGVLQDQFGICGSDPGNSWTGGGVDTRNNNLQVKDGLCDGDTDGWTDPSERFDQIANGSTMTGFGNAPASCASCSPPGNPSGIISGTTPACASTTLSYSLPNANLYWQTVPNGTSTANPTTSTFNATTTGTYYVRAYDGVSCWSTNSVSYNVVIENGVPTITTQPANQSVVIPNTANFNVVATGASSFQWQVNTGTGWNNVSTGTGGTTNSYNTGATSAAMNGYQYRCVVTNVCGSVNSNPATLTVSNSTPNNAQNLSGCFDDTSVVLTWNNPATPPTGGYVIFAIAGTTDPTAPPNDAGTYTANSDFSAAPFETPASLGKVVYKGNATTATVTGLTEGTTYSFRIFAYNGETLTGWSNGTSGGSNLENIAQDDVSNLSATPDNMQMTLNWNNPTPTSCFDELIIVANQGAVTFTPSGSFAPIDVNYSTPNSVVYATTGTVSSKTISGLINGLNYCFKIYIRRGGVWSDGVEICETPIITYCDATSNSDTFNTGITGVIFNTINNTGTSANNTYVDYTSFSTNVQLGDSYDLSVNLNVDGNGTVYSRVWIDWNMDGDFNDSNEEYDLGTLYNPSSTVDLDGASSESPLSIEVPTTASIGSTRMRVAAKWNSYPTSCEDNYSGEIEDYSIVIAQPSTAEINIKGNNITIPNGFNAPYGLNNTLFGATDLIGPYTEKTYFISNLGLTTLNLTNNPIVEIIGTNPSDFIVTQQPSANSITAGGASLEFRIEFRPTSSGIREAQVRIYSNDSTGGENPYIFDIQGTGTCSTTITTNLWPIEGPEDTEVTITSPTDLTGATAKINNLTMPIVSSTAGELVVTVPNGAEDGNIVILFSTGCTSTQSFDVIDQVISSCEGSAGATSPTDIFISEITDATAGSSTLIEIYNGTGSAVNLANYSIKIYNNGSLTASSTSVLSGTLADGGIYVVSVGTTSCTFNNISSGIDLSFNGVAGINFDTNKSDAIVLEKTSGTGLGEKDIFGEKGSGTWANGLAFGSDGVNFRRKVTAPNLPSLTFSLADWDMIDWTNCSDSDYVNIGLYDFSLGVPPFINNHPSVNLTNCDAYIDLTIDADEGFVGGTFGLVYTWFYLSPYSNSWSEITSDGGPYSGFNQATLTISFNDILDVNGYQYYCQVREDSNTCYSSTKAVKINHERAFWDGGIWSSIPDLNKLAVINADYNTGIGVGGQTSFNACNLVVNSGNTLTVDNTTYIEVENNVQVEGNIVVQTQGAFVQNNNIGTFTLVGSGISQVNKFTAPLQNWYDYTYWSSPVENAQIGIALAFANPNRRFSFDANQFLDTNGDDIDDDDNDWILTNPLDIMIPGQGYVATHDNIAFIPNTSYQYNFNGPFNTGLITSSIYFNAINNDHWNLLGNPYPSAIKVRGTNGLFDINTGLIKNAVYLWSHDSPPDAANSGNDVLNFNNNDYAIINGTMEVAGASGIIPGNYIPSGQSFFVSSLASGSVIFNNGMRISGNNSNDLFFGANNTNQDNLNSSTFEEEKLWLNLKSDNGVFSQLGIGYVNNATNDFDGLGIDAKRNLTTGNAAIIYTQIQDVIDVKFAIQGKSPQSLTLNEIINVGFDTSIDEATLYKFSIAQLEGSFLSQNDIFIKDNMFNKIHNLKESDYSFTSEVGEFKDRFEIVFTSETLGVNEAKFDDNSLQIIELPNGDVQFKLSSSFEMKSIEIFDLLGRTLYKLDAQGNSQTFSLNNLSQATYLAKVKLSNGKVITKKAIKRN
jgi:hypothetical protein